MSSSVTTGKATTSAVVAASRLRAVLILVSAIWGALVGGGLMLLDWINRWLYYRADNPPMLAGAGS